VHAACFSEHVKKEGARFAEKGSEAAQ
jgi:hypothetical protein